MLRARLPRAALLGAAAAASVSGPREKPPIYPAEDPQIVLVDTPTELERRIGVARRAVTNTYFQGHSHVQGWVSRWIGVEHAVENRVKSLIPPDEPLTPGLLYVGVATLTGSVVSRNRNIALRLTLPPTLFLLSLNYLLPKTSSNIGAYVSQLEHKYTPALARTQDTAIAHSAMTWERAKDAYARGRSKVGSGVKCAVGQVQDATGLKLREAMGWGENVVKEAEVKGGEVAKAVEKGVEEAKKVVDEKVENAKRFV
ncbi:hypothetical protein BD410DRAFT_475685 [Rickenella mellea]|uniref:MICOS complex subunit n=1 Tax=Rickenella mellea TaxID=50990 RepID=A0A4Y7QI58_9AGAM|nr:hypothetical protein BD410DRAFT_475685 [Rickenella mellea]